jgi:thiosulfate dehydrogenase [quinone] large subunit
MMTSSPRRPATFNSTAHASLWRHALTGLRWPFVSRYASPLWLVLRLYLGWAWLQFSLGKFSSGWLISDPIGDMFKLIAASTLPVPLPFYRDVARMLLDAGVSPLISHTMPFLELAVALSFLSGVLVVPAAVGAILLNANILLSGIGVLTLDGRFIALQLLMIVAWRVVGLIGFQPVLARLFQAMRHNRWLPGRL